MLGDNDCPDCLDQPRGYCEAHIPVEYLCDKLGICEDCLLSRDHWIDCQEERCENGVANTTYYASYCWFVYTIESPNGDMNTARELFPPLGRNDVYGGITQTQARTLAFERLNELESKYKDVQVEMID